MNVNTSIHILVLEMHTQSRTSISSEQVAIDSGEYEDHATAVVSSVWPVNFSGV
jgi:hypothetical protein